MTDSPTFRLGGVVEKCGWLLVGPTLSLNAFPANKSRAILQFSCFHCIFLSHMPTNRVTPTNRLSTGGSPPTNYEVKANYGKAYKLLRYLLDYYIYNIPLVN